MQVRVGSLQELVYKNGQAGVTKASVSIVFNNEDKANSPGGYQHYDQITVTRQVEPLAHALSQLVWRTRMLWQHSCRAAISAASSPTCGNDADMLQML